MTEPAPPPAVPQGAGVRRGRPGYDQETVLRRAVELFNRQGYEGTSMGDLARELGVTKSAIYHHVPSKSHLLEQALDEALDGLTAVVDAAVDAAPGSSAYDRLRDVVAGSVHVLVAHRPAVTLLLRVRGNSEVELVALHRRREIDARLAALVKEAIDEGSLRADVAPALVSRLLFGMVNSLVEWHRAGGVVDGLQLSEAITTIAFDGLALASSHQS
jgi:AcrR family transcriptional regulator